VAMRTTLSTRTVGAIMAFGAGTLISAVTFELVEQAFDRADLWPVVAGLGLGAVAFTAGDAALVRAGGRRHRDGDGEAGGEAGGDGGLTIALGAVLDGVPESLVLGISLASGGAISRNRSHRPAACSTPGTHVGGCWCSGSWSHS
jgi:ZIP family zinc transporter